MYDFYSGAPSPVKTNIVNGTTVDVGDNDFICFKNPSAEVVSVSNVVGDVFVLTGVSFYWLVCMIVSHPCPCFFQMVAEPINTWLVPNGLHAVPVTKDAVYKLLVASRYSDWTVQYSFVTSLDGPAPDSLDSSTSADTNNVFDLGAAPSSSVERLSSA